MRWLLALHAALVRRLRLELGKLGATVVGTATSAEGAEAITAYLQAAGLKGHGLRLQVTEAGACEALVSQIEKESWRHRRSG